MANYAQIAQKKWTANREDGTSREIRITFEEKDGGALDLNIPLVQDIQVKKGSRSDEVNKPIKKDQLTLQLKDEQSAGDLISKVDGCGYRQLRVTVTDVGNNYEEFQGYVISDQTDFGLYKKVQSVKVEAVGQLADTKTTSADTLRRTIKEIADSVGSSLDISRELDVYTSLRHNGQLLGDPIPNEIRAYPYMLAGGAEDANLLQVIQGLNTAFGWQLFQENGRLVFADPWERINNPQSVNKYEGDGAGGFTQKTEDHLITLNQGNVIKGGKFKDLPPVEQYSHNHVLIDRAAYSFPEQTNVSGNGTASNTQGMVIEGDLLRYRHDGEITVSKNTDEIVTGEIEFAQVIIRNEVGADLFYNFNTNEWQEAAFSRSQSFSVSFATGSPQTVDFGESTYLNLSPVPEGVIGTVEVVMQDNVVTISDACPVSFEHLSVRSAAELVEDPPAIRKAWEAGSAEPVGETLQGNYYCGDEESYSAGFQHIEYYDGTWKVALSWVHDGGTASLGHAGRDRIGYLLIGKRKRFGVRIRDLQRASLLSVFRLKDNQGNDVDSLPVEITHHVLKGFYDVRLVGKFNGITTTDSYYSTTADNEVGTGSPAGAGDGSRNNGVTDHGHLEGLNDPEDHPWAAQKTLSNVDPQTGRDRLSVYSKSESDNKFVEETTQLTLSGDGVVNVDTPAQTLEQARTWNLSVAVHGDGQAGVISPTAQNIYGQKRFQNDPVFDSGAVKSPADLRFENKTNTNLRKILIAQATGVDNAVAGGRTITLQAAGALSVDNGAQDLTGDRSWQFSLNKSAPLYNSAGSLSLRLADMLHVDTNSALAAKLHGQNQTGVLSTTAQDIYGGKTFKNTLTLADALQTASFAEADGRYTGSHLAQDGAFRTKSIRSNELVVESFVAEISAALYGEDVLTKSRGVVSREFSLPAVGNAGTLYVEDLEGHAGTPNFEDGDWVLLRQVSRGTGLQVYNAWGKVTGYTDEGNGEQSWTWTRESGGSATTGAIINRGSIGIDYGVSGDAVISRSVLGTGGPTATMYIWETDPSDPANFEIINRIGDLSEVEGYDGLGAYFKDQLIVDISDSNTVYEASWDESTGTTDVTVTSTDYEFEVPQHLQFGKNVSNTGASGLWLNEYNYRLTDGRWRVGDAEHYLKRTRLGDLIARLRNFIFSTPNMTLDSYSELLTIGDFVRLDGKAGTAKIGGDNSYVQYSQSSQELLLVGALRQRTPSSSPSPDPLFQGTWASGTTYYKGDVVKYTPSGASKPNEYILTGADTASGTDPDTSADWIIFVESGPEGPQGPEGDPGPGVVYRGTYDSNTTYYGFDTRSDVVYYSGNYYSVGVDTGTAGSTLGTPGSSTDWQVFGAQFESVATRLLLANNATITHTLTLGTSDADNPDAGSNGIIQSYNFSNTPGSEAGFRLQASGGQVEAYSGKFYGELQATQGAVGGLTLEQNRLYRQGTGSALMEVLAEDELQGLHFVSQSGDEEMWIGAEFTEDAEDDINVGWNSNFGDTGEYFNPSVINGTETAASPTNSTGSDSSSLDRTSDYTLPSGVEGRFARIIFDWSVSATKYHSSTLDGSIWGDARAEIDLLVELLDSNSNVLDSKTINRVADPATGGIGDVTEQASGTFSWGTKIPSGAVTVRVHVFREATASTTYYQDSFGNDNYAHGESSAMTDTGDIVMVIAGIKEFISPLGAQWFNEQSSQSSPQRVKISRNTGEVLGHKHTIEGGGGGQAYFEISGDYVRLKRSDGTQLDSWQL